MLKIATTSINTITTKGTILFPVEWGRIEALQAHTNLCLNNSLKKSSCWKLLQLQSTQQQKGQYCFKWNEEGSKLFKLILFFVWTILSRKAHVENCYNFNQHNNNKRDNIVSSGMRKDRSSSSSYYSLFEQFSQEKLMLKIATTSINTTTTTTTKGTILFQLEWGRIEALQAHNK